jgi:hypothetical protein
MLSRLVEEARGSLPSSGAGRHRSAPGAATMLQRDPTVAPAPAAAESYTLTLSDGVHANVSKADAVALLVGAQASLQRAVDLDEGYWAEVNKGRLSFFGAIGGALTDLAGQDFPGYAETWAEADNALIAARRELRAQNVTGAGEQLRVANAAYEKGKARWHAYVAQLEQAGTRAQVGTVVVAVVAIAVIASGGAAAAALTPVAGGAGAGGAVVGGGVGGAAALGATVPVDAAAAGVATTGVVGGGGAVVGGGAGVGSAAALGTTVPVAAGGGGTVAAGAVGTATAVGVGGATADAVVGAAIADTSAALTSGGAAAATATAEGMSVGLLEAVYGRLAPVLAMNAPFTTTEARALKQVADIVFEVWKRKAGFGAP